MTNNEKNLQEYLKKMDRKSIPSKQTSKNLSLSDHIKEGNKLIDEENKLKISSIVPVSPIKEISPASNNPYAIAKSKILNDYRNDKSKHWIIKEIEKIERKELPENRIYNDFIHQVADLGDKIKDKMI